MSAKKFEERLALYLGPFHPVVPFEKGDRFVPLDFTGNNTELTAEILEDTARFSGYIAAKLDGARYGIGGYGEHRTLYSRSRVFDAPGGGEPRRLHLGTDIWGGAGTPVFAPLEGTVHSLAFNDAFGDYGATLILEHEVAGFRFYSLYGHLSLASIREKREGQEIGRGECLAAFGEPAENGQWPPHLHFQLIIDLEGNKGDYPGVCRYSERERYLANCPDPKPLLDVPMC